MLLELGSLSNLLVMTEPTVRGPIHYKSSEADSLLLSLWYVSLKYVGFSRTTVIFTEAFDVCYLLHLVVGHRLAS